MSIFNSFPLMNAYSVNLDWIIKKIRELEEYVRNYTAVNNVAYAGVWDITKQYPQWAIVTDGNTTWLSNKPVPIGITLENVEYWTKLADLDPRISDILNQLSFIERNILLVNDGDDITASLQEAVNSSKYVYVPYGTYTVSKTVTIPANVAIDFNNSTVNAKNLKGSEYVFTYGEENDTNLDRLPMFGISNLNINCNHICNGILVLARRTCFDNIKIVDVGRSSVGFDIWKPGVPTINSLDCTINHCEVVNEPPEELYTSDDYMHLCAIRVNGSDNYLSNIFTVGSKTGIIIGENGGGTHLTDCHTLACRSTVVGWESTIGYDINAISVLTACYSDNAKTGVYSRLPYGNTVLLENFEVYYWEFEKEAHRTMVMADRISTVNMVGGLYQNGVTRLTCPTTPYWEEALIAKCVALPENNSVTPLNDYSYMCSVNGENSVVVNKATNKQVVCLFKTLLPLYNTVDIIAGNASVEGLKFISTNVPVSWGAALSGTKISLYKKDDIVAVEMETAANEVLNIKASPNMLATRNVSNIDISDWTLIATHTY